MNTGERNDQDMSNNQQDAGSGQSSRIQAAGSSGRGHSGATTDKEAQRRGGEHSHGGRSSGGSHSARGAATDKEAQRRGGEHSHGGGGRGSNR